jgi:hypothetical protein
MYFAGPIDLITRQGIVGRLPVYNNEFWGFSAGKARSIIREFHYPVSLIVATTDRFQKKILSAKKKFFLKEPIQLTMTTM